MRELQKLSKELNPVKNALAALKKREAPNPNRVAAGKSLEKVAARIADVHARYSPLAARLHHLISRELPQLLKVMPLLLVSSEEMASAVAATRRAEDELRERKDTNVPEGNFFAPPLPSSGTVHGVATTTGPDGKVRPSLLSEVCPPNVPYLVQPENYALLRDRLRMQVDIVDYLAATGRIDTARHVAESYGLPLSLFPQLPTAPGVGWPPAPTPSTTPAKAGTGASARLGSGGVPGSEAGNTSLMSPLITPAVGPAGGGSGSLPPTSPIHLPAALGGTPLTLLPMHIANVCLRERHSVTEAVQHAEKALEKESQGRVAGTGGRPDGGGEAPPRVAALQALLFDLHATRLAQLRAVEKATPQQLNDYAAKARPFAPARHEAEQIIAELLADPTTASKEHLNVMLSPAAFDRLASEFVAAVGTGPALTLVPPSESPVRAPHPATTGGGGMERLSSADATPPTAPSGGGPGSSRLPPPAQVNMSQDRSPLSLPMAAVPTESGKVTGILSLKDPAVCAELRVMPDLVARVVGAGVFLKDEYLDRLVLERRATFDAVEKRTRQIRLDCPLDHVSDIENEELNEAERGESGGGVVVTERDLLLRRMGLQKVESPVSSQSSPEAARIHDIILANRVRCIPRQHVCTQSAEPFFDAAMLNVVEELLVHTLLQREVWRGEEGLNTCSTDADGQQQPTSNNAEDEADASGVDPGRLELHYSSLLTPDEMVAAEEIWSSDVLFLKRATRLYCPHTGSVMQGGSQDQSDTLSLPNGQILSKKALDELTRDVLFNGTSEPVALVSCPPTDEVYHVGYEEVRRIFIT